MIVLAEPGSFDAAMFDAASVCVKERSLSDEDLISLIENHLVFDATDGVGQLRTGEMSFLPIEFEGMIAVGLPMRAVIRSVMDAAAVDIPVLITGETGTGKDLIAAAIHKRSPRMNHPYIPVNTGAIARELIASELFGLSAAPSPALRIPGPGSSSRPIAAPCFSTKLPPWTKNPR